MQSYRRNKIQTVRQIVRRIENWPTAIGLRLFQNQKPSLRLLSFRDGMQVMVRGGTRDWDIVHEILFARSYGRAFDYLSALNKPVTVLDLGGNIGLFALACSRRVTQAQVYSFEPGPPNYRLFEINCLANSSLADRIHLQRKAVGGKAREDTWFFDEANPGGSGLFATSGKPCRVGIEAFADVVASLPDPIALAKIDIEGAEYEILSETPAEVWQRITAISLELHDDPGKQSNPKLFLERMQELGFAVEEESVCTFFLHRK